MAENVDDTLRRHNEMIEALAKLWLRQGETNDRMDATIVELKEFNRQQLEINADIKTTLARLETTLARLIERSTNGRDA